MAAVRLAHDDDAVILDLDNYKLFKLLAEYDDDETLRQHLNSLGYGDRQWQYTFCTLLRRELAGKPVRKVEYP